MSVRSVHYNSSAQCQTVAPSIPYFTEAVILRRMVIPVALIAILMVFFILPRYATALQETDEDSSPTMQNIINLSHWAQNNSWIFVLGIVLLGAYLFFTSFGWFFRHLKNR